MNQDIMSKTTLTPMGSYPKVNENPEVTALAYIDLHSLAEIWDLAHRLSGGQALPGEV